MGLLYLRAYVKRIWLIVFSTLFPLTTLAQKSIPYIQYKMEQFSLPGGKLNNNVNCVIEGPEGFLWFGTHGGLIRYDGYRFITYRGQEVDSTSFTYPHVEGLHWDKSDKLWICTYGGGVFVFDPYTEKFSNYKHDSNDPFSLSHNRAMCVVEDNEGAIWIGTEKGLNKLNQKNGKFERFFADSTIENSLNHDNVRSLYVDRSGTLWVGTGLAYWAPEPGGLSKYKPTTNSFTNYTFDPLDDQSIWTSAVRAIYEDSKKNFWVGTSRGLQKMNRSTGSFKRITSVSHNTPYAPGIYDREYPAVYSVLEDQWGGIWVGTIGEYQYESHLLRFDPNNGKVQHFPIHMPAWHLYESSDGTIWVSGAGGGGKVVKITPDIPAYYLQQSTSFSQAFRQQNSQMIANGELVGPLAITANSKTGNIWAKFNLTNRKKSLFIPQTILGRYQEDDQSIQFYPLEDISLLETGGNSFGSTGMAVDNEGKIWGYNEGGNKGIFQFDPKTYTKKDYVHDPQNANSLISNYVVRVMIDSRGELWIATFEKGLSRLNPKTGKFLHYHSDGEPPFQLGGDFPIALMEDQSGTIWVGGEKAPSGVGPFITAIDPVQNKTQQYTFPSDETYQPIQFFTADSTGQIWMKQGSNGLAVLNKRTRNIRSFNTTQGNFPFDDIAGLICDRDGILWVSSFQSSSFARLDPTDESVYEFKNSSENPSRNRTVTIGRNGHIYFPNNMGWAKINPQNIFPPHNSDYSQKTLLVDFWVSEERQIPSKSDFLPFPLWQMEKLELSHRDESFRFDFSKQNFKESEKIQFEYRLLPYETKWRRTEQKPVANYFRVPPGSYTFQVRQLNDTEDYTELAIVIHPPIWKSNWAYALYAILIIIISILARKEIIRRERLRNDVELKKLEIQKLKEIDQLKTHLFANISHEFRTPLTLIQGSVKNISSYWEKNDEKAIEIAVQSIKRNGQNLLNLVNQLLDLAKLDAKELKLDLQTGDIIVFLKDMLKSFEAGAINQKINLKLTYEVDTLVMDFDPARLQQIIFNLVGNALKFTPEGGKIFVKIDYDSIADHSQLFISIEDTGAGIPAKNIPYIFDRFYQADHEQAYSGQGTGIGLSLVKELLELMGGNIEVKSQAGKGTRFKINLPIKNESAIPVASPERMLISEMSLSNESFTPPARKFISSSGDKDKLLLIEDHPELLEYIKDLLSEDYQIITAANGRLGIEKAIEQIPDLIISDVMMPEKNGYEVCQMLKEDSRTSHIPIILLTAKADLKDKIAGWEHGADAYLSKPFQRSELFAIIRQLITQRRKLQELYRSSIPNPPKSAVEDKNAQKEHIFLTDLNRVLEENLENEKLDVGLICEQLDMSRSQVHRKLKALTGFSTTQYIRKIRLHKAKALLESNDTEVSVADVAYMVGFKDRTHFSRTFSEEFGLPPSFFKE